ncbi:MAG TPA: flippase activity-associated protein Agl23, partial [Ktedonobacterales bacterium]
MSARQNDDRQRQQTHGQQASGSADLTTWEGQAALAFSAPQGPLTAPAPTRPEPARPATDPEPDPEPDDEAEVTWVAGPSAGAMLAATQSWLRRLPARLWDFIRSRSVEQWAWVAVLLVGALLRFWDLGAKPLHHDESMHAFYSLLFARDPSSYTYDPLLHGPFQFHAEGIMFGLLLELQRLFHVGGLGNNPWINDTTARIVPALFGLGIVALPVGLRRELGRFGALLAALLLAVSPSFVYFSRFLREDIYFNFFMFAMVVCAVRFASSRKMLWLALTAASATLAYATFEGVYLTLAIFGAFLAALLAWELAEPLGRLLPKGLGSAPGLERQPLPAQPTTGPFGRLMARL